MAPGYFFDVMTEGYGVMPDYAAQISTEDRWAIAAYIEALQFSQQAHTDQLEEVDKQQLRASLKVQEPETEPAHH